jgi:hypothetical protein
MTTTTIAQQRLYLQRITSSEFGKPVEVVQWLGALQAQDYASAAWTIGLRIPGATAATVEEAIAERAIVRTWLLRGTLHIVTAADLRWMRSLLAPSLLARFAPFHRQLGLDDEIVAKSYAAITQALEGDRQLTRIELLAALARSSIEAMEGMRASNLINRAALDGLICLGPMRGKQPVFVLLDEWLPAAAPLAREEALAALALRYFGSHGPATLQDFAWWTGLPMADARAGYEAVKAQLLEERNGEKSYWRAGATPPMHVDAPSTHLLPGFDEYVLGYSDRSDIMEREQEKLISGVNAVFAYTMILDGRVAGTWKRTLRKSTVEITLAPFAPLPSEGRQGFAAAARRYGEFLELSPVLKD